MKRLDNKIYCISEANDGTDQSKQLLANQSQPMGFQLANVNMVQYTHICDQSCDSSIKVAY